MESIRSELLQLQETCCCLRRSEEEEEGRKRRRGTPENEEDRGPERKRSEGRVSSRRTWGLYWFPPLTHDYVFSSVVLEEEILRLQEENAKKVNVISELREKEGRSRALEEELRRREEEVQQLKQDQVLLEQKVQELTGRRSI